MGDLGTVPTSEDGGGQRSRCVCGAWYATLGDNGAGAWIYHDERILAFATRCRVCARLRALFDRNGAAELYLAATAEAEGRDQHGSAGAAGTSAAPRGQDDVRATPAPSAAQRPRERPIRRRSDVRS